MSLIGYFSMQLIGVGMGRLLYVEMLDPNHYKTLKDQKIILLKNEKRKEDKTSKERKLVLKVVGCEILIYLAYLASRDVFG